ncbi:MAG: host attachment protein [Nitrospirae bacterium]|nr:host attachment protein [Nitrospirota bacterium]
MNRIVIVTDLGHFKYYRLIKNDMESPRLELQEEYDIIDAHKKLSEMITDRAGRFGMGNEKKDLKGYGEAHNLELENKKKIIRQIAEDINKIIKSEGYKKWYLVAGKTLNSAILERLDPKVKEALYRNIVADHVKTKKSDLLEVLLSA